MLAAVFFIWMSSHTSLPMEMLAPVKRGGGADDGNGAPASGAASTCGAAVYAAVLLPGNHDGDVESSP